MMEAIYFDMDGTLAGFYNVPGWLDSLMNEHTKPYREARPLVDMRKLGAILNALQANGYHIGIVSWLSKSGSPEYDNKVIAAKLAWLKRHIGAVNWNEIKIVPYGTPKASVVEFPTGLLFDDEAPNREDWTGEAHDVNNILEVLTALL